MKCLICHYIIVYIKEKGRSLEVKETMWRYYNSP
jgi:hypothetical protein